MSNSESFLSVAPPDNNFIEKVAIEQNLSPKTTYISSGGEPSISADGRYVAFTSSATNLVPGDTENYGNIFVRDRQTGIIEKINVAFDGTQAKPSYSYSCRPSISADGRYVAFQSSANNLVPDDINDSGDIFVRDRQTGITEIVSIASDGTQANGYSDEPSISADGRYVAFTSRASNLVPGDTNEYTDIFVRDRQTGTTERVNVADDGNQANAGSWEKPSISADGRYVAFQSWATNLVPGNTENYGGIFVRDRQTGTTERVNVSSDGTQANEESWEESPSISADGRYVAFQSSANNLVPGDTNGLEDIFVRDRHTGITERVNLAGNQANSRSGRPSISADGRYVAFTSFATNLVPDDTNSKSDIFVCDRQTRTIERVNVADDGNQANDNSWEKPSISADGRYVAFTSFATNLVPGNIENYEGIFVRDRGSSFSHPDLSKYNIIDGTPEKDLLLGTPDKDRINGFAGDDTLIGRTGDDILYGDFDNDSLFGNEGNDRLFGGDGRDSLFGNSGDDFLYGGADDDLLVGGPGADQFVLRESEWYTKGLNTIVDYLDGTDSFLLDGGLTFEELTISQGAGRTLISVTETNEELAVLIGVEAGVIGAEDFTTLV